jgi:hypothetical protein
MLVCLTAAETTAALAPQTGCQAPYSRKRRFTRVDDLLGVVMARLEAGKTSKSERQQWTRQQVLEKIRDIIVEQVGVRREQVTLEATLRGDLAID